MKTKNKELFKEIQLEKTLLLTELYQQQRLFDILINSMIAKTPTGELRNELSEINILHSNLMDTYNDLFTFKTI